MVVCMATCGCGCMCGKQRHSECVDCDKMVFCILKTLVRLTAVIILGTNVFKEQLGNNFPIFSYKYYFFKLLKYVDINALAQVHSGTQMKCIKK